MGGWVEHAHRELEINRLKEAMIQGNVTDCGKVCLERGRVASEFAEPPGTMQFRRMSQKASQDIHDGRGNNAPIGVEITGVHVRGAREIER